MLTIFLKTRNSTINVYKKKPSIGYTFYTQCGSCNATYYDKIKRHLIVRMCEHLGISALTGKRVKGDDDSATKKHLLFCNHATDFGDF